MPVSLSGFHRRLLQERGDEEHSGLSDAFDASALLAGDDWRFRLVETRDKTRLLRREWIDSFVSCPDVFSHSEASWRHLAQAERAFSVLLVSAHDTRRLFSILRDTKTLFPGKAIVPVLCDCSPELAAELLGRGADDVFHCAMDGQEAAVRLQALVRRMDWAAGKQKDREAAEAWHRQRLQSFVMDRPSPLENRVLSVLAEREGQIVPYFYLASRVGRRWDDQMQAKSLQVVVCHLRKKLATGVHIISEYGHGYRLYKDRDSNSLASSDQI